MEKSRNCSLGAISPLFHNIFLPVVRFSCLGKGTRFSLRDKRLFEISEIEITRVNCNYINFQSSSNRRLYMKFEENWPWNFREVVQRWGRTTDDERTADDKRLQ